MRVVYGLEGPCRCLSAAAPGSRAAGRCRGRPEPGGHWKIGGIDAFAGPDRPLCGSTTIDAACHAWATARRPTLLVSTDPEVGLTRATPASRVDRSP